MKKSLNIALLLTVSFPALLVAEENLSLQKEGATGAYELKADAEETYQLKDNLATDETSATSQADKKIAEAATPRITKEEIAGGYIERLLDENERIIAEKRVVNDEIEEKILNYYYPDGALMRRVRTTGKGSFEVEEYYANGKIASQSNYLNENSRIGKEKKYDVNSVLRQEIPWVVQDGDEKKPANEQQTIRQGNVITYFPNGRVAAIFAVNQKGKNSFYNQRGKLIKTIENAELLSFAPELDEQDCNGRIIKLTLEDLVALYEDEGDVSYDKCGLPYRENFVYEVMDTVGRSTIRISYDASGMIRKITPYIGGLKQGIEQKFDASGNLTAEINYDKGEKDGIARGYFPNRTTAFRKRYKNGKVVDTLTCYFPNGETAAEIFYKDGKKDGVAKIYGANARKIKFTEGEIDGIKEPANTGRLIKPSQLPLLKQEEPGCVDVTQKLSEVNQKLAEKESAALKGFELEIPEGCEDLSAFKPENSVFACYVNKQLRAVYPVDYKRGDYAVEKIYNSMGKIGSEITYVNQQKEGLTRKYDEKGKLAAEIFYHQNKLAESSRSYYPNGTIKNILTFADNAPRRMIAGYEENGRLKFSINYNNNVKEDALLGDNAQKQDIYIRYYDGRPDTLRETAADAPDNYTEYNLALGEYTVYEGGELVKGGRLCGYKKVLEDRTQNEPKTSTVVTAEPVKQQAKTVEEPQQEPSVPEQEPSVPEQELRVPEQKAQPQPELKFEDEVQPSVEELVIPASISHKDRPEQLTPQKQTAKEQIPEEKETKTISALKNAILPTVEEKKQAELASQNIGPVAKPDIEELTDVVEKAHVENKKEVAVITQPQTEKSYYQNGNLRKIIKTRGGRTEEVKEYSKTGLLITDTSYKDDGILIEKYFGTGEIRRKTHKDYTDNAVMAFISREDFYDNGNVRYEISRQPGTLLFTEKQFYVDGKLKVDVTQDEVFKFIQNDYNQKTQLVKITELSGLNTVVKEYNAAGQLQKMSLNGKEMPLILAKDSTKLLEDNSKIYAKNGSVRSEMITEKKETKVAEYGTSGKLKTEIIFYNNGEIMVKGYDKEGELAKMAYLSADGKLNIQKPVIKVIPSYRERYWVEYNNPRWVENQDKYSIYSIARLSLDTAAYILAELEMEVPEMLKKLYEKY